MAKARRVKIRKVWKIRPSTKVKESGKIYKRSRTKSNLKRTVNHETKTGNTQGEPSGIDRKDIQKGRF